MTRPIIFRAKAVSSGQWVYGNLIHSKRFAGWSNEWRIHNQDTGLESDVLPETVGQFTGLMDRNEGQIFEGDILHSARSGNYVVHFSGCSWRLTSRYNGKTYTTASANNLWIRGNIHDNPELI